MQERVQGIKSSEEVGVRYMQEWEERELDRREAREEGREEGIRALIETLQELGVSRDTVKTKAAEKFSAEPEMIERYMEKYWK